MLMTALVPPPTADLLLPLVAALLVLVGAVTLTVPSGGIVGGSRVGAGALIVFGACGLVTELVVPWVVDMPPGAALIVGMSLAWLAAVAGAVAAIAVLRARVVGGFARWVFVLPALSSLLCAVLETIPLGGLTLALTAGDVGLSVPVSLLLTGVALVGFGRWRALRRHAGTIDAAWRESTSVGSTEETSPSR